MPLVEQIVDLYINGNKIYIFIDGNPIEKYTYGAIHGNVWQFDVFTRFTNFLLRDRKIFNAKNILLPLKELEKANSHCVVMCPFYTNDKNKLYLIKNGFILIGNAFSMEIYKHK